ncbi:uncharacterized protein LOC123004636 isoform X2 [Tribolium madens]|uniref:uncharacterized protein LOC123004636 isoform X2 n=1 Tax=Tribolium madens TaxID=41895 RepID=UPI001CF73764|nr:uncharacterized protein LOC123004636 isoform X2 [Tribolium madens]
MEAEKKDSEEGTSSSTADNVINDETITKTPSDTNWEGANSGTTQNSADVGGSDDNNEEKQTVDPSMENTEKGDGNAPEKTEAKDETVSESKIEEKSAPEDNKDTSVQESPPKAPEKDDTILNDVDITMPPIQTLGKGKRARIPNKRYSDILLSPQSRSHKTNYENGDKHEKIEHEAEDDEMANISDVTSLKSRTDSDSPAAKKMRLAIDISDPKYRKPFLYGWKRELVYRATSDNPNKRNGDIYYYTPTGKKVRSMRELAENLKGRELTVDNFTFYKEPIGLDDPEKEIIRDAKAWNKKTPGKGGIKTPKVLSPKMASPKVGTPKGGTPKVLSPKTPEPEPLQPTRKSGRNLGNIKVKLPPSKTRSDRRGKVEEEPMEVEPSLSKRAASKKNTSKALPNVEMEGKPCQPCSIRCQGVMGMVPTLQCRICLCLYHYECVGLSSHIQIQAYVCKNCQLEHGQSVATSASIVLPPLTPINTLKSMTTQSSVLPTLQRIPRPGDSPQRDTSISGGVPNMPRLLPLPKDVPTKQSKNPTQTATETKSLVGSVTTWLPHSSTIQVDNMRNKENEPIEAPRPQYVEYLAGRKFLIIPKHNVVSVSPTVTKPTNFESVSGEVEEQSPKNTQISSDEAPAQSTDEVLPDNIQESQPEENKLESVESPRTTRRTAKLNSTSSDKHEEPRFMDNYLQNLSYGYNTLLYVFQYLKVQDLLRAGCVCTMWRDIANHPSLWRTVRMKNSQVHSFEGLANTLKKHGTVHLDLRKMLLPTNGGDDIWPEFSRVIEKVQTLRKIELCRCPASVVEQLAVTNKDLEVINAVTIKCESMSLDKLSLLKNLKELRLKSTSGLTLSSDITSLKELTSLTHLSLTSIKDLNKMSLSVIAALKDLESLDLGECNDFPSTFGDEILIKLKKLEKLRLEKGQGECHTFEILDAVRQMPYLEQLELVNFDIKSGFDVALGACSNIKKLLIIPTYISQSATTNHMVLGGVLRLQSTLSHFVWGVTLELLRVTELFVDQCEDPDKKEKKDKKAVGNGDSIPVLKPVPLITDKYDAIPPAHDPPQVEILPLPNLQKLLLQSLPTTRVKILKIPFHATWRQSITDTVN